MESERTGRISLTLGVVAVLLGGAGTWAAESRDPSVEEIAAMLPQRPAGFGRPITDRAAWAALAKHKAFQDVLRQAETYRAQPIPPQPDELFLDYSKTGNRTRWQKVAFGRRRRLGTLVLGECLQNRGRFLPAIEALIAAFCGEHTWVMPAHDRSLANFRGKIVDVDLAASHLGWELATARWMLGDRLSAATRRAIDENLRKRIFDSHLSVVRGKRKGNWWLKCTNNWNAVCLAGVTGAALAAADSRRERAEFVAAALTYSKNFLRGFTPDGYCSEGLGYWCYGFGYYVLLSEAVWQATGGKIDMLANPTARAAATFPERIEIAHGISPAFADCSVRSRAPEYLMHFLRRRMGRPASESDDVMVHAGGYAYAALMYSRANSATKQPRAKGLPGEAALRSWFPNAGVLVCRPAAGSAVRLGAALKGGHNAEHHNHNDVGSYVLLVGKRAVLLDPGSEVYTARTFSSKRYVSKVLNSFGHPVPVVAGALQRKGRSAAAKVLKTEFTDARDTLALDITAAYPVKGLKKLHRTFVYSRSGEGSLTVLDEMEAASPQTFETALITLGDFKRLDAGTLVVYDVDEAVRVRVDTGGAKWDVVTERIKEDVKTRSLPLRIGIRLKNPTPKAVVRLTITPTRSRSGKKTAAGELPNGGFEDGRWGWDLGREIASISTARAATGARALCIVDESTETGSNVLSVPVGAGAGQTYRVQGRSYVVRGEGVGVYVRFLDEAGSLLNRINHLGHMAALGTVPAERGRWLPFEWEFRTPAKTRSMQVWIHSFNGAKVEAFLDDLCLTRLPAVTKK